MNRMARHIVQILCIALLTGLALPNALAKPKRGVMPPGLPLRDCR